MDECTDEEYEDITEESDEAEYIEPEDIMQQDWGSTKDRIKYQFKKNLDALFAAVYNEEEIERVMEILSLLEVDLKSNIDMTKIDGCIKSSITRYFAAKQTELHKIIKNYLTVKAPNGSLTPKPIDKSCKTKDFFYDMVFELYETMDASVNPLYDYLSRLFTIEKQALVCWNVQIFTS